MMEWPHVRLATLVHRIGGGTPSRKVAEYWGNGIPWFTVADLDDDVSVQSLSSSRESITEKGLQNSAAQRVPQGAVVISTRVVVGRVGVAANDLATNQDFCSLIPRNVTTLDSRFLAYFLLSARESLHHQQRGLTILGVPAQTLDALQMPLPSLSEQRLIVRILDQAARLRRLRVGADAKADRILPALYRNIFLDRASKWPRETLGTCLRKAKGALQSGPFGSHLHNSDFVESGPVRVVGIDNVLNGEFSQGRDRRIALEKYEELKKYTLESGDILVTIMGTVGRCCVFPQLKEPAICTKHVYRIQVDKRLDPEYVSAAIRFDSSVKGQLGRSITGQIVAGITSDDIRRLTLLIPPMALQNHFATHVRALAQQRTERRRASAQLDHLFQMLLRDAFSGKLTARWRHAHVSELRREIEHTARSFAASSREE
jgi:type I restriction enzyme S subunit